MSKLHTQDTPSFVLSHFFLEGSRYLLSYEVQSSRNLSKSLVGLRLSDTCELGALSLGTRLGKSGRGTADPEWQRVGRARIWRYVRYTTLYCYEHDGVSLREAILGRARGVIR